MGGHLAQAGPLASHATFLQRAQAALQAAGSVDRSNQAPPLSSRPPWSEDLNSTDLAYVANLEPRVLRGIQRSVDNDVEVKAGEVSDAVISVSKRLRFTPHVQKPDNGVVAFAGPPQGCSDGDQGTFQGTSKELCKPKQNASIPIPKDCVLPRVHEGQRAQQPQQPNASTSLESYLPPAVCAAIYGKNCPFELYPWQAECLARPGVLQGKNLVYCAPTSGGKSIVSEIILLRRLLLTGRPALLVLPFVSLCAQKTIHLRRILEPIGRGVTEMYGPMAGPHQIDPVSTGAVVCTIEKANSLVNRMLEEGQRHALGTFSTVILDELHMVGDEERGYQLELVLTKLRYCAQGWMSSAAHEPFHGLNHAENQRDPLSNNPMSAQHHRDGAPQVVGMSATLPNVDMVAQWLEAELFVTTYRPVRLRRFLKVGNQVIDEHGAIVRELQADKPGKDPDHVGYLTGETVANGHSVLVFCASRAACVRTALYLAEHLQFIPEKPRAGGQLSCHSAVVGPPTRDAIITALRGDAAAHPELLFAVERGVAFHHAGMDAEERGLVEHGFMSGAVSVLCATSTLAAGVNLPARRVIFKHPYVGRPQNVLDPGKYLQMAGRAGRAGIDTEGEAYLVAVRDVPIIRLRELMTATPPPIESCLDEGKRGMARAMLEVVASGLVATPADVERYVRCTLLAYTRGFGDVAAAAKVALRWLGDRRQGMVLWDSTRNVFRPTAFGRAALAAGLAPDACMHIRADVSRAREAFVLTAELHLAYLCVPLKEDLVPDRQRMLGVMGALRPAEASVAAKVGVDMAYVVSQACGTIVVKTEKEAALEGSSSIKEQERVCRRFWAALMLTDLLQEKDLMDVASKYGIPRGLLQGLQDRCARYAGMVSAFCSRLGWNDMEILLAKFQCRLHLGGRPELLDLMEIPFVKAYTARLLYRVGFRKAEDVAAVTDVDAVTTALLAGRAGPAPWEEHRRVAKIKATRIVRSAKELVEQKARVESGGSVGGRH